MVQSVRKLKLDARDCIHVRFLESRYICKYQDLHDTFYPLNPRMGIDPLDHSAPGALMNLNMQTPGADTETG